MSFQVSDVLGSIERPVASNIGSREDYLMKTKMAIFSIYKNKLNFLIIISTIRVVHTYCYGSKE